GALLGRLQAGDVEAARDDVGAGAAEAQRPIDPPALELLLEDGQELVHVSAAVDVQEQPPDAEHRPRHRTDGHRPGEEKLLGEEAADGALLLGLRQQDAGEEVREHAHGCLPGGTGAAPPPSPLPQRVHPLLALRARAFPYFYTAPRRSAREKVD